MCPISRKIHEESLKNSCKFHRPYCPYFKVLTVNKAPSTLAAHVEATLSNAASRTILLTKSYVAFRQSLNKLNMFDLCRICWKNEISFDIVVKTGNVVVKNGNSVEATFDFVKRMKFYDELLLLLLLNIYNSFNIVPFLAAKSSVATTLLLVWTGLNCLNAF